MGCSVLIVLVGSYGLGTGASVSFCGTRDSVKFVNGLSPLERRDNLLVGRKAEPADVSETFPGGGRRSGVQQGLGADTARLNSSWSCSRSRPLTSPSACSQREGCILRGKMNCEQVGIIF